MLDSVASHYKTVEGEVGELKPKAKDWGFALAFHLRFLQTIPLSPETLKTSKRHLF
jgi:hypothetical protein